MGALLSALATLRLILKTVLETHNALATVLARINTRAGLPCPSPTSSAWQATPHPFEPSPLPDVVDVLIIGSGITGAGVAHTLLTTPTLRIAMVDAREICSGATGRNGGHIKFAPYGAYPRWRERFGRTIARELVRFRLAHLDALTALADTLGPETVKHAEIRRVRTLDVFFERDVFEQARAGLRIFLEDFPELASEWEVWEGEEAQKRFALPHAVGAFEFPAGALSPYNLITSLLASLLKQHPNFSIHPHTPITSLAPSTTFPGETVATTASGATLRARYVVHATNAHASYLLPGLTGKVFPVRGTMTAQPAGSTLPNWWHQRSWTFVFRKGYDYMTQRPDGTLMLGGARSNAEEDGTGEFGNSAEDAYSLFSLAHLRGLLPVVFGEHWGATPAREIKQWTGLLGWSADLMPWVGELPDDATGRGVHGAREFIAAGFSGLGMPNAWLSGVGIGKMILGNSDGGIPPPMRVTPQRVRNTHAEDYINGYFRR
jgi:glycine/D-amino acid oxidase-like deaminating enzyme